MVVSIRSGVVSIPWKIELFVMLCVLRMLHCSCSSIVVRVVCYCCCLKLCVFYFLLCLFSLCSFFNQASGSIAFEFLTLIASQLLDGTVLILDSSFIMPH